VSGINFTVIVLMKGGAHKGADLNAEGGHVTPRCERLNITLPNVTDPVRGFNRQALIGTPIEAQERADEPRQIRI
jgi:hypothetical protein